MKYYILTLLSVFGVAIGFYILKKYQIAAGSGLKSGLIFNSLSGALKAVVFIVINGFHVEFSIFSLIMAALTVVFSGTYTLLGFKIMSHGKISVYTFFLMLGGMIFPYLFGLLFLTEKFNWLRTIGLLLMVVSIYIIFRGKENINFSTSGSIVILCFLVFVLNGFVSIFSKVHQIESVYETVSPTGYVILTGVLSFVFNSLMLLCLRMGGRLHKEEAKDKRTIAKLFLLILVSTVVSGVSYLFQLISASNLPATVLYPMLTGGSIVLTAIVGQIAFNEKVTRSLSIGIVVCFIATLMFL